MTEQTTARFYVASAWWRDCDPFVRVAATDRVTCETTIQDAIDEEYERVMDVPDDERPDDDIAWSGIFEETSETINLSADELAELEESGYVFLEV